MIFDSQQMQKLLKAYETEPDFMVPEIVFLARTNKLENERAYFEELFAKAPPAKHKDWLGRLLTENHEQFRSAWFEIMLYGWLMKIGSPEVEPVIEGNYPDYSVDVNGQIVIVEARAFLQTPAERDVDKFISGIFWALKQIKKPFLVEIVESRSTKPPEWNEFQRQVSLWLDSNPADAFEFNDGTTIVVLKTIPLDVANFDSVRAITSPGMAKWITSQPLKKPLREKAHQHSAIRKSNYPYVIALYLEPGYLSAEEVAKAWLGEEVWTVDFDKKEVVDTHSDRSGIHFAGSEIRHTTVSGTLVFKSDWAESEKCSYLRAWYVENPFANVYLDPMLFPVEERYIVVDKLAHGFQMAWVKDRE